MVANFIKQIYAVKLIDAFPKAITAQNLSWSDDGFHRLSVQFSYQRYETIYRGQYDFGAITTALIGAGIAGTPTGKALQALAKGTFSEVKSLF